MGRVVCAQETSKWNKKFLENKTIFKLDSTAENIFLHSFQTIEEAFKVVIGTGDAGTTPDLSIVK